MARTCELWPRRFAVLLPAATLIVASVLSASALATDGDPEEADARAHANDPEEAANDAEDVANEPEKEANEPEEATEADAPTAPRATPVAPPFVDSPHPHFSTLVQGVPLGVEGRAQARFRVEALGPRDLSGGSPDAFVAHRLRLGTTMASGDFMKVSIEFQDVRNWGEEMPLAGKPNDPTLFGYAAPSIDLHQGFAELSAAHLMVRVGRQEIAFDNQRLIGAVDWTMQGRSFDGVRAGFKLAGHTVDAFAVLLRAPDAATTPFAVPDAGMLGAHYQWSYDRWVTIAPLVVVDAVSEPSRVRWTGGARAHGDVYGLLYDLEGYYQGAVTGGELSTAALVAGRAGYVWDGPLRPKGLVFVDVVSGNSPTLPLSAFDTLFATNHKFYGFADLFLNLPLHTRGRGLVDLGAHASVTEGDIYAKAFLHVFTAADLDPTAALLYGVEPDVVAGYKSKRGLKLEVGASIFVPLGDGLGRGSAPTPWMFMALGAEI